MIRPFHLAFPVNNLSETRGFYVEVLGCTEGRSTDKWLDFSLYGHQLSAHLCPDARRPSETSTVDNKQVPVLHWGVILEWNQFRELAERIRNKNIRFVIEPHVRFAGEPGEQATMFFLDPSGNALEFKAFKDDSAIFAT